MNTQERIEKSQKITILLPNLPKQSDSHKALLLACGLSRLGKEISIEKGSPAKYGDSSASPEKTFVVSLKGLAPWISKVYYEKREKDVKLFFTLQQGEILPENVSLQAHMHGDLTIIVGDKEAQHNSLSQGDSYHLDEQEAMTATLVLLFTQESKDAKLLSIVLRKLRYSEKFHAYVIFLTTADFTSSSATPKNLIPAIQYLKQHLDPQSPCLFFYQWSDSEHIQGILHDDQRHILSDTVLTQEQKQQRGNWAIFSVSPERFHEITQSFPLFDSAESAVIPSSKHNAYQ